MSGGSVQLFSLPRGDPSCHYTFDIVGGRLGAQSQLSYSVPARCPLCILLLLRLYSRCGRLGSFWRRRFSLWLRLWFRLGRSLLRHRADRRRVSRLAFDWDVISVPYLPPYLLPFLLSHFGHVFHMHKRYFELFGFLHVAANVKGKIERRTPDKS